MIMCTLLSMVYGLFKPYFTLSQDEVLKKLSYFFNLHWSCFAPLSCAQLTNTCSKLTIKKIGLIRICPSLKINTACHCSFVFVVDFDHSQHVNIVFLLLTFIKYMFWQPYFKVYLIQEFPQYNVTVCSETCINRSCSKVESLLRRTGTFESVCLLYASLSHISKAETVKRTLLQTDNFFQSSD